jgi:hypothetical protein
MKAAIAVLVLALVAQTVVQAEPIKRREKPSAQAGCDTKAMVRRATNRMPTLILGIAY